MIIRKNIKMIKVLSFILLVSSLLLTDNQLVGQRTDKENQNVELGKISWFRDYNDALQESKVLNKPIFILFQEVPGCSTCQNYGKNILSNPLLVDIIENEFIPLAIFNNKKGEDRKILKSFKEPSWNNPVVRIINHEGQNLVSRLSGNYSLEGVSNLIRLALVNSDFGIKKYADIITQEMQNDSKHTKEAFYSMYCFWTGEAKLGQIEGVLSTEPGFMNGKEVVKITYDKEKANSKDLAEVAKSHKFSFVKDPSKFRTDKDEQYYLKKSVYKYLPLSPIQRTKINSALAHKKNPESYLSPTQIKWKKWLEENKHSRNPLYTYDINDAWSKFKTE